MRKLVTLSLLLALAGARDATPVQKSTAAQGFTPAEKSVEAFYEAVVMSSSKLLQEFGPADAALSFSGTFADGGWQGSLTGDYAGQPVNVAFTGTFDGGSNSGSFTTQGTYGTGTWSGDGTWSYTQPDPSTLLMSWDSQAVINWLSKLFKPDKHFTTPKRWARSVLPDGTVHVVDSGSYRSTRFGIPFGPVRRQISDWIYPPHSGGGGIATVTVSLSDEAIDLSGYADFGSGAAGGKINMSASAVKQPVDPQPAPGASARR
jgi:hypothetical protein